MHVLALGLALLALPVTASSPEPPAAATPRPEVTTTERYALQSPAPRSQHRDDESGGVILELRLGPEGGGRKGPVHCSGHVFSAIEERPGAARADYLTKR
jgi:hypothetical protein